MKERYRVTGQVKVYVEIKLDAESPESAIEKAQEYYNMLENSSGNGGADKLIGVYDDDGMEACVYSDDEIAYYDTEAIGEAEEE